MKTIKTLFTVAVLGIASVGAANAAWMCSVSDAKQLTFTGTGGDRASALASAMAACSKGSTYAKNCVVQNCSQQ
ncbi:MULTISPECIES: hypothetical protein [Legionella]|uniref:DUF4189 domain-containing protein n=1 Tax=Legionella maceachernii TaxID=466 RepID=A0A0W0VV55_9GAMM|nr:hypothetical protein [Legionella maceachernii]KTD23962.1 hypothetical protein Lmac_2835 [Legionella maceachernii]SKA19033.1 hypothetical protein SAMN02745128_02463 [Legionella maceachernii]SUP04441.1 Uncharacterised protein [Legionella maceachernii]